MKNSIKKEEFIKLYENYYNKVFNYVFCRILNKEITEDIVSDVFTKIFCKYESYNKNRASIFTWIMTITKNTLIDFYRKESNHFTSDIDINLISSLDNIEENQTDNQIKIKEDNVEIFAILNQLNDLDKKIIYLRYFQDMSYKEISKSIGHNSGYVGVALSRATKKFKKKYKINNKNL